MSKKDILEKIKEAVKEISGGAASVIAECGDEDSKKEPLVKVPASEEVLKAADEWVIVRDKFRERTAQMKQELDSMDEEAGRWKSKFYAIVGNSMNLWGQLGFDPETKEIEVYDKNEAERFLNKKE